jgi:putative membrane-bound dehydrogenase-like protein
MKISYYTVKLLSFYFFLIYSAKSYCDSPKQVPQLPTLQESLNSIEKTKDVYVTAFAHEPVIGNPTAIFTDDRNRLWVAENYSYSRPMYNSNPAIQAPDERDKISILEDTNGDGKYDKRKVFTEDVGFVYGIQYGFGGVYVAAPPNLLFFPDRNRDDIPDAEPVVLLDGWAINDEHTTINNLNWGPDGWLYGNHGVFCDSKIGKPGTKIEDRIRLNAGFWRYHPIKNEFEVFARGTGNPWGMDFDAYGQMMVTLSSMPHLWHISQGAYYQPMMPYEIDPPIYVGIGDIGQHSHTAIASNPANHAHAGALFYTGSLFPESYKNKLLMLNIGNRALYYDQIAPEKSSYSVTHAGELLHFANNDWFLGSGIQSGANGELYISDFNDYFLHGGTKEGRETGRIYRLTYQTKILPKVTDLNLLSDLQLAKYVLGDDNWFSRRAVRILTERRLNKANLDQTLEFFYKEFANSENELVRLRAFFALQRIIGLDDQRLLSALSDSSAYIRAWSIQFALEDRQINSAISDELLRLAKNDQASIVRLYLASALQRMSDGPKWKLAEQLLNQVADNEDPVLPKMYWYGIKDLYVSDPLTFKKLIGSSQITLVKELGTKLLTKP